MKSQKTIAFIVGTGLWKTLGCLPLESKENFKNVKVGFGDRKAQILYYEIGYYKNLKIIILPRHGVYINLPQRSPAELIQSNAHEAHIWLLYTLGVTEIYAFNSVGALSHDTPLGDKNSFIVPNCMSYGLGVSVHSFGSQAIFPHPEMNECFSEQVREKIKIAVEKANAITIFSGLYIYSNPDHLETQAEGDVLRRLFGNEKYSLVGSTAGAELVLSKEMGLQYATICTVANYVRGSLFKNVTHENVVSVMKSASETLLKVMENILILNSK